MVSSIVPPLTTSENLMLPAVLFSPLMSFWGLHIDVLLRVVLRSDDELAALVVVLVELDGSFVEDGAADAEGRFGRGQTIDCKESERGHHVPSAQLSLVLVLSVAVAMNAVGAVELVADGTHPLLREVGTAAVVEEPRDVEARLIALIVVGAQAGEGVNLLAAGEDLRLRGREDVVQALVELVGADLLDKLLGHVGHIEGVLHGVAFLEAAPDLHGVEVSDELAVLEARVHVARLFVEDALPSASHPHQLVVVLRLAEALGKHGCGVGREGVFEGVRAGEVEVLAAFAGILVRRIAQLHEVGGVVLACSFGSVLAVHLVLQASFVGKVEVEVADAALVGRVNHQGQLVGAYAGDVLRVGQSVGQPAAVLILLKRRGDKFGEVVGISQRPELRQIPLSAPHRVGVEHVILRHSVLHRHLSDGAVVLGISTVHVAHHASAEQRMVEACVELLEVVLVLAFHADASESFPPNHLRGVTCLVEAHACCLCLEVDAGILDGSIGDAHLDGYLIAVFRMEVQVGACSLAVGVGAVFVGFVAVECADEYGLLIHHGREIDALVGTALVLLDVFGERYDPSLDGSILADPDFGVFHFAALALLMADVEDEVRHLRLGIGEAHEGDALGCRHLGVDVIVVEHDPIVAGCGFLIVVGKAGTIAARPCAVGIAGCGEQEACGGSHGDAAHLELVGADEALDGRVAIVVACGLPAVGIAQRAVGGRAGLSHTEGHGAGGEVERAAVSRADAGFYIL